MSDFSTLDLLIENMDSSLDGPLSSREVECVAKGWRQGEATANAEITRLQADNEVLRARVAELEDFVADTAIACQRSLDPDWVPDWVQDALIPLSKQCRALLGDDPDEYESSWLLRKQAEAVESLNFPVVLRKMWSGGSVQEWLDKEAQRLRTQATALERQSVEGGE